MTLLSHLFQDSRTAWRLMIKNLGATTLSVLSIAIGVGLTAFLFSIFDALALRDFPFSQPDQIFGLRSVGENGSSISYTWADYENMRRAVPEVAQFEAFRSRGMLLEQDGNNILIANQEITETYFATLGVKAAIGRASVGFTDGQPEVVLSHKFWMSKLGGDRSIIGRTIVLNQRSHVVVGVMDKSFSGARRFIKCDVWVRSPNLQDDGKPSNVMKSLVGYEQLIRLPDAAILPQIEARLDAAIRGPQGYALAPKTLKGTQLQQLYSKTWKAKFQRMGLIMPVFAILLFICCANVAQMRLAQTEGRRKDFGVMLAMGASPRGLARMVFIETAWIGLIGTLLGAVLSHNFILWLQNFVSAKFPILEIGIRNDWRVLGFAVSTMVLVVLFSGFAPARLAFRQDMLALLQSGNGTARTKTRWQTFLIAGQTAISVLVFGLSLLFLQSWYNAASRDVGFDTSKAVALIQVENLGRNSSEAAARSCRQLETIPGVRRATFTTNLPLHLLEGGTRADLVRPELPTERIPYFGVGDGFFEMMGTRLIAGRTFQSHDTANSAPVVMISRSLGKLIFGERNPIGESIHLGGRMREIIGVTKDVPTRGLHDEIMVFAHLPHSQSPSKRVMLLIETEIQADAMLPLLIKEVKSFSPASVITESGTLEHHMSNALLPDRIAGLTTTSVGLLGFALTAAGLFGVIQYAVNRRTREIGIRIALGAGNRTILNLILGESLRIVRWGLLAGFLMLGAGAHLAQKSLLNVSSMNPWMFLCATSAAFAVAILAAWLPARRAAKINPVEALRAE